MMDIELEAEIYYLTEEEGGRKSPVKSGYRGQFHYNGRDWDAPQEFIGKEICYPGETVKVVLQTLSPIFHVGQFYVGQEFETREGGKTVGKAKITNILREDFNYWDYDLFFSKLSSDCCAYDRENLNGFMIDFDYAFRKLNEIKELNFSVDLSYRDCMLTVECILRDEKTDMRPLVDKICDLWVNGLSFKNNLWKTYTNYDNQSSKFELLFVTWHSIYLTGKIEVNFKR